MRKICFIFILIFTCSISFSQTKQQHLKGLTREEIRASSIIPPIDNNNTLQQKVMACPGSAANDNWANAQSLAVNGGSVSGTTCGSFQAGETAACNTAGDPTVWYKFVASAATIYVKIDLTGGNCYFGSAVYGPTTSIPSSACGNSGPISCQSSSGGPLTHLYQLANLTIGATYYVQIIYPSGGLCGSNATFNIGVTTTNPGGTITNQPPLTACSSPGSGCFFNSPPAAASTVTSACTSYPLAAAGYSANSVWSTVIQFTSSASWSNFSWQAIITSNCLSGNVVWLNWALYDCNCNQLACGDINTLTGNGLACGTCYRLMYQMELANCSSFTTVWPYQNVPSSPTPCNVLPIELLYFTAVPTDDKKVNVEWAALSEVNVRDYELYRSDDGVNFRKLATVKPKGQRTETAKYRFKDDCCQGVETRYYKLISVETDGAVSYEKTIAVTFKDETELVKFAPNPAQDNFVVTFGNTAKDEETVLQLFDGYGKLLKEEKFTAVNGFRQFDIKELPSGIYFINVITPASGNNVIRYKLIKE